MRNQVVRSPIWRACVAVFLAGQMVRAEPPAPVAPLVGPPLSPGLFAIEQLVSPLGRRLPSLLNSGVNLVHRPRVSRSSTPLRQFTLLGGDRFLAEIVDWNESLVHLRLQGGHSVPVPRAAIAIVGAAGESDLVYESFEPGTGNSTNPAVKRPSIDAKLLDQQHSAGGRASLNLGRAAEPVVYDFPGLPAAARVQFWFLVDADERSRGDGASTSPGLQVDFEFQADSGPSRWTLNVASGRALMSIAGRAGSSTTRQDVPLQPGWHCVTAGLFREHAICTVDDSLLVAAGHAPGRLKSIRLSATAPAWIDDLQVSQFQSAPGAVVLPSGQDDCLVRLDGTQWFGRVKRVTSDSIVLSGPGGDRAVAWHDVDRLALSQPDRPVPGHWSARGWWSAIVFQSSVDRPNAGDRIMAAVTHVDRDVLIVTHPWLGEFAIGWNQISRIEPQFFGTCLTVDARTLHLGNAIREDFSRPVPDGTEWNVEFDLPPRLSSSTGAAWLSLDAADLEPSSVETPPGSPFLKELRAGRWLTELTVNTRPAGSLNQRIRFRAPPGRPDRLRFQLPAGSLRPGRNVLRLNQIPLTESGTTFDNCELSNLRLEIADPRWLEFSNVRN